MKKTLLLSLMFVLSCGQEPTTVSSGSPEPSISEPAPEQGPSQGETVPTPVSEPVSTSGGGGGGGGGGSTTTPPPEPECSETIPCLEGFTCTDSVCIENPPPPECLVDVDCGDANQVCVNQVCEQKPCAEDVECTSPAYCLKDLNNQELFICREEFCPMIINSIDPNSLIVNPDLENQTIEEIQADIDFTMGQLQLAYMPLSELSEAIKACEIEADLIEHQADFDALDAVRIQLDNHLAYLNIKKLALENQ